MIMPNEENKWVYQIAFFQIVEVDENAKNRLKKIIPNKDRTRSNVVTERRWLTLIIIDHSGIEASNETTKVREKIILRKYLWIRKLPEKFTCWTDDFSIVKYYDEN